MQHHDLINYKKAYVILQKLMQLFPPFPLPGRPKHESMAFPANAEFENLVLPSEFQAASHAIAKSFSTRLDSNKDIGEEIKEPSSAADEAPSSASSAKRRNGLHGRRGSLYITERALKAKSSKVRLRLP
eukprot:TRINITY_DN11411_c0_g2_i3.p2 TRINITY_DN11411_c0_g2~~TRINITY_DN11411_c0_g2_i3.p2  ORF type:complete len:129 (-),score=24.64 TRINITY_DN11411_c0_g2_i3:234-620(-)